jgi:hypothetical protein
MLAIIKQLPDEMIIENTWVENKLQRPKPRVVPNLDLFRNAFADTAGIRTQAIKILEPLALKSTYDATTLAAILIYFFAYIGRVPITYDDVAQIVGLPVKSRLDRAWLDHRQDINNFDGRNLL